MIDLSLNVEKLLFYWQPRSLKIVDIIYMFALHLKMPEFEF